MRAKSIVTNMTAIQRRQHGAIHREQLTASGLSRHQISSMVQRQELRRVLPEVYVSAGSPGTRHQALMAAALWAGPDGLISGRTAAELFQPAGRSPRIEVLVPATTRRRHANLAVRRTNDLRQDDRFSLLGIPVTSPARTVIECAATLDEERLELLIEDMLRAGRLALSDLVSRFEQLRGSGRPGTDSLARVLALRGTDLGASNQLLEIKAWHLIVASGLPRPERNLRVRVAGEPFELDLAWADEQVALECDGFGAHGGVRAFRVDKRRRASLIAAGWRVIEATWEDVTDPIRSSALVDRIRRTLELGAADVNPGGSSRRGAVSGGQDAR